MTAPRPFPDIIKDLKGEMGYFGNMCDPKKCPSFYVKRAKRMRELTAELEACMRGELA